jgi:hypothetical protein
MKNEKSNVSKLVDELGRALAEKADMDKRVAALKKDVLEISKKSDVKELAGELFRAKIVESERGTLNMKKVREKLSAQFIRAHTAIKEVVAVKVTARKESAS